jgi:predicted O-methyltransferase YrrM
MNKIIFNELKFKTITKLISNIKNPNILELGVQRGLSTKKFLEICDTNNGYLTSIDINDCSSVSKNKRWKFIHSSDDDFEYIKKEIENKNFDILFIDSLHEPSHIKKVFYFYFNYLKKGGLIFVDDVVWLPYIKNSNLDNEYVERINRLIFKKIIEIFNANSENLTLDINFSGTGLAVLKKIGEKLNNEKKIPNRLFSLKNIIKNYIYSPKPKK